MSQVLEACAPCVPVLMLSNSDAKPVSGETLRSPFGHNGQGFLQDNCILVIKKPSPGAMKEQD